MSLQLRRLDSRSFSHLMEQWNTLFQKDDILWEHSQPYIEHAQRIASEPTLIRDMGFMG